jgi:hypothetical protein
METTTKRYPFGILYDADTQNKDILRSFALLHALFQKGEFTSLVHPKGFDPNTEHTVLVVFQFRNEIMILTTTMGTDETLIHSQNDTLRVFTDPNTAHKFVYKLANLLLA